MNFKLGFGPMSEEVINTLCDYSHDEQKPLMLIASRNQVDAESGYVMTTPQLRKQIQNKNTDYLWVCRDHCGPYFLDIEKGLPLTLAIEATKKTIAYDIEQGFDLIHIDTSRVEDTYGVAEELINFCINLNPSIKFEFGTEENVGVAAGAIKYKNDVTFAKNFPNMKFVVAQTGSLCFEDHQAGSFNREIVRELVNLANANGVGLKEHNADYLTAEEIQMRKHVGVHAMNIAPQLGVVQTKLLHRLSAEYKLTKEWAKFSEVVLASNRWKKWTVSSNNHQKVVVAGHYCFGSPEYRTLVNAINKHCIWEAEVSVAIYEVLHTYTANIY